MGFHQSVNHVNQYIFHMLHPPPPVAFLYPVGPSCVSGQQDVNLCLIQCLPYELNSFLFYTVYFNIFICLTLRHTYI